MRKIRWIQSIPFFLMHLGVVAVFFVPFSWGMVALCVGLYYARMFGVTAGYHRYFAHRTYKLSRVGQFLMALLASSSVQKGVLWWAANHRHHHRYSDQPEDLHSPVESGFWWSHVGWILGGDDETRWEYMSDFGKYPELRWLNRYHLVPGVALAVGLFLAGGWSAFVWGFVVSTVLLWHGTFTINSLSHVFGSRRFDTRDDSRNNFLLALITMGEGWHNNHHRFCSATRQGFYWYEIDASYLLLRGLAFFGFVEGLREPPPALLEEGRGKRLAKSPVGQVLSPDQAVG